MDKCRLCCCRTLILIGALENYIYIAFDCHNVEKLVNNVGNM